MLYANVVDFGAVGDGVTDDTIAFQNAVVACSTVLVPAGTYLISQVNLQSNSRLSLDPSATLLKLPAPQSNAIMLYLNGLTNVTIEGGTIDGNLQNNPGGQCHGIGMAGGSRIRIRDVRIVNMPGSIPSNLYGDGVYVGSGPGGAPVTDLVIDGCTIDRCDRHCVFFVAVDGAKVVNCTFSNLLGTSPGTAINFEPNVKGETINNVLVQGCELFGNYGGVTANNHYNVPSDYKNVRFVACTFSGNKTTGLTGGNWGPGWVIDDCRFQGNADIGLYLTMCAASVTITNSSFSGNLDGARLVNDQFFKIEACDFTLNQRYGLVVTSDSTGGQPHYGTISNCQVWNNSTSSAGSYDGLWISPDPVTPNCQLSVTSCWFGNSSKFATLPTQNWGINFAVAHLPLQAFGAQYIGNRYVGNLSGDVNDNGTNFHLQVNFAKGAQRPSYVIGARLEQGQSEAGYGYLPSSTGKPSGAPVGFQAPGNGIPFVVDQTGHIWMWISGAWK